MKKRFLVLSVIFIIILLAGIVITVVLLKSRKDTITTPNTSIINTSSQQSTTKNTTTNNTSSTKFPAEDTYTEYSYKVINEYPHDAEAFTQGLVYEDGYFYEGTGINGQSSIRKVDLLTGNILQKEMISDKYFGEGIVVWEDKIFQLTWQSQVGFIYDKVSFDQLDEFEYPTEGWGITHDEEFLIMSDGTSTIYFWDPETLQTKRSITVTDQNRKVDMLNELEYINGRIYANIWLTNYIVKINPITGEVTGKIDFTGLLKDEDKTEQTDVLNGIAYDQAGDRLFVTGKRWPKIFEIELIAK